jgi:hypothetical protein
MLLLWDCGLHSYELAKGTRAKLAQFLGRVPSNVCLEPIAQALDGSYYALIYPSDRARKRRGEHLMVRVIEYTLTDPGRPGYGEHHRLITSLLDASQYPALELACAYHERWEFELTVDETDTHQRLAQRPLRSKKPVGVIQELYGLLIAHYAVRKLMHEAALQAGLDPDRISFSNSIRLICSAVPEFQLVHPTQRPMLYQRLLQDMARHPLPSRADRSNPRVVKRKMSKFDRKRPEHYRWPQPTKPFREAVCILI